MDDATLKSMLEALPEESTIVFPRAGTLGDPDKEPAWIAATIWEDGQLHTRELINDLEISEAPGYDEWRKSLPA